MRVKKTRSVYLQDSVLEYPLFTEPNQSFTPRQIVDQFSRGELSAKSFEPSDSIDGDSFSDDVMVDNIIEFEDEFSALEFMHTTKVKQNKKKDGAKSKEPAQEGTDEASDGSSGEEA